MPIYDLTPIELEFIVEAITIALGNSPERKRVPRLRERRGGLALISALVSG